MSNKKATPQFVINSVRKLKKQNLTNQEISDKLKLKLGTIEGIVYCHCS